MTPMNTAQDLINTYLEYQLRCLGNASRQKKALANPFVTISREAGAGGITIGQKLIEFLKKNDKAASGSWTVFDKNLVTKVLEEHNLPARFAELMPEGQVPGVEQFIEELYDLRPSEEALLHKTTQTIFHLAQLGNSVLVGRGSNIITQKLPYGFHVRLVAPRDKRIPHIQEYYRLTRERAVAFIKAEDTGRKKYLKKYFDKDIDDPLLYDLVINTDSVPYEDTALIIGEEILRIRAKISL